MEKRTLNSGLQLHIYPGEGLGKIGLYLAHGMTEHIGRYHGLIKALGEHGITVYSFHYPGHGPEQSPLGHMNHHDLKRVKESMMEVHQLMRENHQRIIHFAHSMGTFITRALGNRLQPDHMILSGTGQVAVGKMKAVKVALPLLKPFIDEKKPRSIFPKLLFADLVKAFPESSPFNWISSQPDEMKAYEEDPYCGTPVSLAFVDMFVSLFMEVLEAEAAPKSIAYPITFISGHKDPVGDMGEGVRAVKNHYEKAFSAEAELALYEGRHEVLHDVEKDRVVEKIISLCKGA